MKSHRAQSSNTLILYSQSIMHVPYIKDISLVPVEETHTGEDEADFAATVPTLAPAGLPDGKETPATEEEDTYLLYCAPRTSNQ